MNLAQTPPRRDPPTLTSVIIPCRNGAATLGEQLDALTQQTYCGAWEVILVDNGSTDGSVGVALSYAGRLPGLRVVPASVAGVSPARNAGAAAARGDLLAFCDADDVVDPSWLTALVRGAAEADLIGGPVELRLLNGVLPVAWRGQEATDSLLTAFGHLPYTLGGNTAVWREVVSALGGWDVEYVAGSEDVDFAWRAQAQGFTLGYAPDAIVHYRLRETLWGLCSQFFRYAQTEALLYQRFRPELQNYTLRDVAAAWLALFRRLPQQRTRGALGRWAREASYHLGHAVGSVRLRVIVP